MKGAILLSFLSVIYLWRGYEFPFSFEAEEALIFFLLSIAAIFFLVASLDMLIIYFSIDLQGLDFRYRTEVSNNSLYFRMNNWRIDNEEERYIIAEFQDQGVVTSPKSIPTISVILGSFYVTLTGFLRGWRNRPVFGAFPGVD
jgi:hypothetical protein